MCCVFVINLSLHLTVLTGWESCVNTEFFLPSWQLQSRYFVTLLGICCWQIIPLSKFVVLLIDPHNSRHWNLLNLQNNGRLKYLELCHRYKSTIFLLTFLNIWWDADLDILKACEHPPTSKHCRDELIWSTLSHQKFKIDSFLLICLVKTLRPDHPLRTL